MAPVGAPLRFQPELHIRAKVFTFEQLFWPALNSNSLL
jgi:hypothetical protein